MPPKKRLLKIIIPTIAIACTLVFIPWDILHVWASPLPDSIQEEVDNAIKHGMDGIIVAVNQAEKTTLYAAGWKDRDKKIVAAPNALFKFSTTNSSLFHIPNCL